jgi:hypothetical protein
MVMIVVGVMATVPLEGQMVVGVMATVTISRGLDRGWCNGYRDHLWRVRSWLVFWLP